MGWMASQYVPTARLQQTQQMQQHTAQKITELINSSHGVTENQNIFLDRCPGFCWDRANFLPRSWYSAGLDLDWE